jgi:hypothetical protein
MNDMLDPNKMAEATRLTRAGRLTEAVAVLQHLLRAECSRADTAGEIVPTGQEPKIISATINSEPTDCPPSSHFRIDGRPSAKGPPWQTGQPGHLKKT